MKEKKEFNWMILFWLGIAIIIIWILAKKAGLFNTPLIIEVIPYFGGLVTILAVVKEFGKMINKLDNVVLCSREKTVSSTKDRPVVVLVFDKLLSVEK